MDLFELRALNKAQASADVTSEEQRWIQEQGRRLRKLRGDVSFFRFPLTSDQVLIPPAHVSLSVCLFVCLFICLFVAFVFLFV